METSDKVENQIELTFFPLDIDYEVIDEHAVVRIFGITPDKRRVAIIDRNFAPHFRAIIRPNINSDLLISKLKELKIPDKDKIIKIQGVQIRDKKFLGETVNAAKITVSEPSDVTKARSTVRNLPEIISTQEFDIKFYRRYLIDKNITPCTLCRANGVRISKSDLDVDVALDASNVSPISSDLISDPKIIGFTGSFK